VTPRSPILALALAVLIHACAGAQHRPPDQTARIGVETAAVVLAAIDRAVATAIASGDSGIGPARWEPVVDLLEHARGTLLVAQASVDAWTRGGGSSCPARAALEVARADLAALAHAIPASGFTMPQEYGPALAGLTIGLEAFAPACHSPADGGAP
jgi:hypothetical protein